MRLFLWGVLIVVLCYAAYSGMIAFSSWMKVNSAVDDIVSREGVEAVPSRELKKTWLAVSLCRSRPVLYASIIRSSPENWAARRNSIWL